MRVRCVKTVERRNFLWKGQEKCIFIRAGSSSHLLEERDLSGMIQLVLHHAMKHVVESVVRSLFARNLLVKPRVWENRNGFD